MPDDDRWSIWAAEQTDTNGLPKLGTVLALATIVTLLLLGLLSGPEATADGGQRWQQPACAELARLERHGVSSGPSYRRVARACRASLAP